MTDKPMPVPKRALSIYEFKCEQGVSNAATRLNMSPVELAEALQDGGIAEMVEALRLATNELSAIRARDGAPQHIDWYRGQPQQQDACTKEWWNELTEKCWGALAKLPKPKKET